MINLLRACRLLALCISINRYTPCTFFEFSGHVEWVSIRVHEHGWQSGCHSNKDVDLKFRGENFTQNYKETLGYLKNLKKKCAGSGNSEMAHTE